MISYRNVFTLCLLFLTNQVWAVAVTLTGGDVSAIKEDTISFTTTTGVTVPAADIEVEEDDDGAMVILIGGGGSSAAGTLTLNGTDYQIPASTGPISLDLATGRTTPLSSGPISSSSPDTPFFIGIAGGGGDVEVPDEFTSRLGIQLNGTEISIVRYKEDVGTTGGQVFGGYDFGNWTLKLSYTDYSGDDSTSAEVQDVNVDTFIVNQNFDSSNSTGVFIGPGGGFSTIDLDLDGYKFNAEATWPCGKVDNLFPFVGLTYGMMDLDVRGFDQSGAFTDVFSRNNQMIESDIFKLSLGARYMYPISERVELVLSGAIVGQRLSVDWDANQTNTVFSEQPTISDSGSDSSTSFGASIGVGLNFPITNKFSVYGGYNYETGLDGAGTKAPVSGNDLFIDNQPIEEELESVDVQSYFLGARLRF